MKRVNFCVAVSVLVATIGCSEHENAAQHIEKAKNYAINQQVDESLIEFKNAIQLEPKNADARFLLGNLYLTQGNGNEAVKELSKALELNYLKEKVIPLLARAFILISSDDEVIALDEQTQAFSAEVKSHYLAYKTLAAIRIENIELAKASQELANSLSPANLYSMLSSAYLSLAENKLADAKVQVARVLTLDHSQPDALLLQGQIFTALGEHEQATQSYLAHAKAQPKSTIIVLFLAESLLKEKKFDEAEQYADRILTKAPNQPFAHYVKSMALFDAAKYQQASEHAETALRADFNQGQLKLIAGASAYFLQNFEQSYHHLSAVIKFLPAEHPARKMYAVSQLQLGLVEGISDTITDFDSTSVEDSQFLSSLSFQLAELGAFDAARDVAKQVTQDSPLDAEQSVRAGILKLMLNDPSGMKNLQDAISLKPDMLAAELALAYAAIQTGDFEQALAISKKWQDNYPDKPGGYNVLAGVYLKQNKLAEAKQALEKSLTLLPNNIFALVELANIAQQQNDADEAKRLSALAVAEFPQNVRILKQHYAITKNDAALQKIKALYDAEPLNLSYGILYAEVLLDRAEYKAAFTILEGYQTSINTTKRLWQLKIIAQRKLNDSVKAQAIIEDWLKTNPYHIEPTLLLVDLYANNNQADKALNVINKALGEHHKNNKMLQLAKMQLLLDGKRLAEAKIFYQTLQSDGIESDINNGFAGRIYLLEKNYVKASPLLEEFYQRYPTTQNAILLAFAQQNNQQKNDAVKHLEQHLEKNKNDDRVRDLLANLYLEGNTDKAMSTYEQLLVNQPNNIVVLNNLAWLYLGKGEVDKALSYAEKAYQLAPTVPNVPDTYAQALLKSGKKREALIKSKEAYQLSKGQDVDIVLNYIEILISNSRNNEAKDLMATAKPITSAQKIKAQDLLNAL